MIAIVDYGMGNLASISNILKAAGSESVVTNDASIIRSASKLILPGVGAFDAGMRNLHRLGLVPLLEECALRDGVPLLGICLGMQLMARRSEEGTEPGLGWVDADVIRFDAAAHPGLKVPHMGWNSVRAVKASPLLATLDERARFYFVHSYHVRCRHRADALLEADYGDAFDAAFECRNLRGVQFHPEKSHRFGMALMKQFVDL